MDKITNTRCVVTGLGMISAIGNNVDECFANALAGKTGFDKVASVDTTDCYANLGAEVHCDTLDEIDEALDDSNVTRFAQYLHKLTKNTQFIVITHSRGTMTAADRLFGITMQEKGVSTLVSVDLLEDELTK